MLNFMSLKNGFQVPSRRRSSACKMMCFMVPIISVIFFQDAVRTVDTAEKSYIEVWRKPGFDLHHALGLELDLNPSVSFKVRSFTRKQVLCGLYRLRSRFLSGLVM